MYIRLYPPIAHGSQTDEQEIFLETDQGIFLRFSWAGLENDKGNLRYFPLGGCRAQVGHRRKCGNDRGPEALDITDIQRSVKPRPSYWGKKTFGWGPLCMTFGVLELLARPIAISMEWSLP